MLYVTPAKFRTLRMGISLDGLSDVELAAVLSRASATTNGYTSVPIAPTQHDFRGGTVGQGADGGVIDPLLVSPVGNPARAAYLTQSGEAHSWRVPTGPLEVGSRRYYPMHWPVKTINLFRIFVTGTQFVQISANDLYIQNQERYIEVVSLAITSVGLFNALIIPNIGLATPNARCWYTYGHDFIVSGEEIYPSEGNTLYRAENQWWLNDSVNAPVSVYVNGVKQTSGYTVDYDEGTVLFATPPGPDYEPTNPVSVTVDYHYRMPAEIRDAVALISRYVFAEANLAGLNMTSIGSLKIGDQLAISRPVRRGSATVNANNLDTLVPEAADLLTGFKFWRAAA